MMNRHTIAPPVGTEALDHELRSTLLLSMVPGLGPRTLSLLLERFGSAQRVLEAGAYELASVNRIGPKLVAAIRNASQQVDLTAILEWCHENATQLIFRGGASYPRLLPQIHDAPPILFCRGTLVAQDELAVAIVGTRHATPYGLKQANRFARDLAAAGVTVVSGLARGIDASAHRGAIEAGGRTLAVLGGGLAQLYPPEHRLLAQQIAEQGAVISEYAPQAKPKSGMFPQRNRLISGLSLATFVVEAPERSGALITTRLAMEQNREVLALPGPINSRASRGCNQLIRDGAKLVQSVDDILEELGPLQTPIKDDRAHQVRCGSELRLNELERQVLDAISPAGSLIDQVIQRSGLAANRVIAAISVLELRRLVKRTGGQQVARI